MSTPDVARDAVRRDWTRVLDALAPLTASGWATPTRCEGWSLRDLVRHAVWGTSMEADALRRAHAGEEGVAQGDEPAADATPEELLAALRSSVAALGAQLVAVAELGTDAAVTIPFGTIPLAFALEVFTMEAGVHADDVLAALGRDEPLGDDVVAATTTVLAVILPVLAASDARPPAGTVVGLRGAAVRLVLAADDEGWTVVAPDVPATARVGSADDTALLRFALGRLTTDDAALEVDGAADFKRWFPGP